MSRAPCKYGRVSVQTNSRFLPCCCAAVTAPMRNWSAQQWVRTRAPSGINSAVYRPSAADDSRYPASTAAADAVTAATSCGPPAAAGRLLEHRQHRRHDVTNVVVGRASGGQQRPRCAQCVGRRVGRLVARRPRRDDETGARRERRSGALRHHVADRRRHVDDRRAVHPANLMWVDAPIEDVDPTAIGFLAQPHRVGE